MGEKMKKHINEVYLKSLGRKEASAYLETNKERESS